LAFSFAASALAGARITKYDLTGWRTLIMESDRIVATGGSPVIASGDGSLRLVADKIVLRIGGAKERRTISTVEAVGGVRFFARRAGNETIQATCRRSVITPGENRAVFEGNVKIVSRDRLGTSELTAGTVTLDTKTGRVTATSSPSKSRLSSTLKSGEKP